MSKMEQHLDATLEQILELARWAPSEIWLGWPSRS